MLTVPLKIYTRHAFHFTFFFFNDTATTEIYTLSLHDALPIYRRQDGRRLGSEVPEGSLAGRPGLREGCRRQADRGPDAQGRSEEHTSELQSRLHLVCRLLLEKKKKPDQISPCMKIPMVKCRVH